jgi:hypothetical protein
MFDLPRLLVAGEVALDLRRPLAERPDVGGELGDLPRPGEGVAVRGQRVPERRVGGDGGVPNPVDRRDRVPDRDGVQPPPLTLGEDAGVDPQMKMAMRVPGEGGVVPNRHRLNISTAVASADREADASGGAFCPSQP